MIQILSEHCIGCGQCIKACPFSAIVIEDKKAILLDSCTGCGSCVDTCKKNAIQEDGDVSSNQTTKGNGVWVFAQVDQSIVKPVSYELLGCARQMADQLSESVVAVVCSRSETVARSLIANGADSVLMLETCPPENDAMAADALAELIGQRHPEILLIGATVFGRSLAPRVAAKVGTGLTADCTQLELDPETGLLMQIRPAFGGNLMAAIVCPNARPQMATVRPKVLPLPKSDPARTGKVEYIQSSFSQDTWIHCVELLRNETSEENISNAEILVSVGKGIGAKQNIALAKQLADLLGGSVSGTRAVVDAGWLPYSRQVGQTGKTVSPKIYIACGISGAIQHVVGLAGVQTVIAINKDPHAPIFEHANIGIVGDSTEVLTAIISALTGPKES